MFLSSDNDMSFTLNNCFITVFSFFNGLYCFNCFNRFCQIYIVLIISLTVNYCFIKHAQCFKFTLNFLHNLSI